MSNFGTVVHYCTNDYRFIGQCIAEAKKFSDQIVIPVCDHFFNGQPENRSLLNQTYADHPDCTFVEFAFTPGRHYSPYSTHAPSDYGWIRLWNAISRNIGFLHLRPEIDHLLFLDCDEIPEGERVAEWLGTGEYRNWNCVRFLAYYYALRPTLRAKKLQNLVLLARRATLEPRFFVQIDDRYGIYQYIPEPKIKEVRGPGLKPLFHHYSWVRSPAECFQKADSWGHRNEKNWAEEIERAFEEKGFRNLFGNVDLEFEEIAEPYFDPISVPVPENPLPPRTFPHVKKVGPRDIFQMELSLAYADCRSH